MESVLYQFDSYTYYFISTKNVLPYEKINKSWIIIITVKCILKI